MSKRRSKSGRGRLSSVDLLPEDLRVALDAALREKRLTQREIVDHFNELLAGRGEDRRLSTSSVNRYALRIEEEAGFLRDAREAARAIVGPLQEEQSDLSRAVAELLKGLAYDAVLKAREETGERTFDDRVAMLSELGLAVSRIELASKRGVDREIAIRKQIKAEQAVALDKAVARGDLDHEAAEKARRALGFAI